MEHIFLFSADGRSSDDQVPQAVGLDTGETHPVQAAAEEDMDITDWLLEEEDGSDGEAAADTEGDNTFFEDDEEEDDARWGEKIDGAMDDWIESGGPADQWKSRGTDALDEWEADGEDKVNDMELEELLELISRREDRRDVLLRRVQSEIREELNRRGYNYIEGNMSRRCEGHRRTDPAFFVPSVDCHTVRPDLSIILEGRPHCCVRFKVTFPVLCGPEMAPALLLRLAERNQSMRCFSWNYGISDHSITLCETVPFWDEALSHQVLSHLMDDLLCLSATVFPELEWLSTGIITTKVDARQLEQMETFLTRLENGSFCLSSRPLQRLRDGLAAVPPQDDDG